VITWTLAPRLPGSAKTDLSVLQWTRHRDAACNAVWPITHKVMLAMAEGEAPRRLGGLVQLTTLASAVSATTARPSAERQERAGSMGCWPTSSAPRAGAIRPSSSAIMLAATPPRRRGVVLLRSPVPFGRDAAAVDVRRDTLRSLTRTKLAGCRKLSWLSNEPDQVCVAGHLHAFGRSETINAHRGALYPIFLHYAMIG